VSPWAFHRRSQMRSVRRANPKWRLAGLIPCSRANAIANRCFTRNRYCAGIEHSDIDASFNQNGAWILPQLWKTKNTFSTAAWTAQRAHRPQAPHASPAVKGGPGLRTYFTRATSGAASSVQTPQGGDDPEAGRIEGRDGRNYENALQSPWLRRTVPPPLAKPISRLLGKCSSGPRPTPRCGFEFRVDERRSRSTVLALSRRGYAADDSYAGVDALILAMCREFAFCSPCVLP
jgi:hypothetical protein